MSTGTPPPDELATTRGCLWALGPSLLLWVLGLALLAVLVCYVG